VKPTVFRAKANKVDQENRHVRIQRETITLRELPATWAINAVVEF
jgi:hypothetical protein